MRGAAKPHVELRMPRYGTHVHLISFTVQNFRRFVEPSSIKLHSGLIALIGPNEAGKSSILDALELLHSDEPYVLADQPRRSGRSPRLAWSFQLDAEDIAALADIPGGREVNRVVITKQENGARTWVFHPEPLKRELASRGALVDLIDDFTTAPGIETVPRDAEDDFIQNLASVKEILQRYVEDLGSGSIQRLATVGAQIETLELGFTAEINEDDASEPDEVTVARRTLQELRDSVGRELRDQARRELEPNPATRASTVLNERLPKMLAYKQEHRDLSGTYDLEAVAEAPPPALQQLCVLAELDLVALREEIRQNLTADVATRRDEANRTLVRAFDQSWNQQKVALQIERDGTLIFIHAISLNAPEAGQSQLVERSDGMRWFASLLAFVHSSTEKPILLVDEIETHLHYDAQADLVNVLARQEFTSKVIYTTHSFGCLPPDIGAGIRLVEPIDETTSRLANGFWKNGVGFSPLLTSMGAAAVSFTPSRHVAIVEGPADAILLPTLIRQASQNGGGLPFQIVPGVAEVAAAKCQGLTSEAGHVVFVVDGDAGGLANRQKLIDGNIDPDHIVVLNDPSVGPLETEDLIDVEVYVRAVNDELSCWAKGSVQTVTAADLGSSLRTKALEEWCKTNSLSVPDKVAVAERVVDKSITDDEMVSVCDSNRKPLIRKLRADLVRLLKIEDPHL